MGPGELILCPMDKESTGAGDRPRSSFLGRNWVDVAQVTADELVYILETSARVKAALQARRPDKYKRGKGLDLFAALLFFEPSTRTRFSFEIAAQRLGLKTVGFAGTEATSVKKGESLLDTVDMFDAYDMDALILRHPLDGAAKAVTENMVRPSGPPLCCFNGGDGKNEHPTQGLLDVFTINECCGRVSDLEIGIAVDPKYGRTTHSFPVLLSLFPGNRVHVFSHPDLRMPQAVITFLQTRGVEVKEYYEDGGQLAEKLPDLDFLYMTRLQRERFEDEAEFYRARDLFFFTPELLKLTRPTFGLGHPLPDDKENPSIHPVVKRHPRCWAKRQAGNGVPTRLVEMALSLGLLGHDFEGEAFRDLEISSDFFTERNMEEHRETAKSTTSAMDIRPLENGTVIDHVEKDPYGITKITRLLGVNERGDIFRTGVVEAKKRPGTKKGVLMIKDRFLDSEELRLIAAIAPGATVNDIRGGQVVRKRDLFLPQDIEGLSGMQCTNHHCITRKDFCEHIPPRVVRMEGEGDANVVKCFYCNNLMASHELF